MDPDLEKRLSDIEAKIEMTRKSAEITRKYMLWTVVVGLVLFILPLIALMFIIPQYLNTLDINGILSL